MPSTTRKKSTTTKRSTKEPEKTTSEKGKTRSSKAGSANGKKTTTTGSKKTKATTSTRARKTTAKSGASRTSVTRARAEKTWTEEISVAGNQLVDKFKELVSEGTVRRVVFKHDGNTMLEVPLAAAVVGGALAVWAAPVLSAVAAVAGAATHVTVEVERNGERPAARAKSK